MRRLASIVAAGFALAVGVGCGSGDPKPVPTAYTSITRSRAHIVATALTIRAADLPEFKVTAHAAGSQEGLQDPRYRSCVRASTHENASHAHGARAATQAHAPRTGVPRSQAAHPSSSPSRPWARAQSRRLVANSGYHVLGAYSSVSVMPTPGAARLEIAGAQYANRTCLEHVVRAELAKERRRVSIGGVVVEPYSASVKGVDASVAYRAVMAYKGAPLVAYVDVISFSYGQDVMTLTTYHASKPVPPAMEERLLGLLVARARSHRR
jgi:hypothetical protein